MRFAPVRSSASELRDVHLRLILVSLIHLKTTQPTKQSDGDVVFLIEPTSFSLPIMFGAVTLG